MLRHAVAAVLLLPGLLGAALAQSGPLPERRVVTTTGQDFYGSDIGSIFETSFQSCREACLGNPACKALTYNTRAEACFLKSGVERREPFEGAVSAEMIDTTTAAHALAAIRRGEISFVSESLIAQARTLAGTLGGLLKDWTGRRWMVSVSDSEAAQPTLAEQRQAAEAAEREEVLQHPLVQAALETFPGAELLEVRQKPGQEGPTEPSEEGDAGT